MAQGFGDNCWVGFGVESTFGTPVARTVFTEFTSESIKLDAGKESRSSLRGRSKNRRGQKKKSVDGTLEMQVQLNGMEVLFKHALGAVNTIGTNPYDHTFTCTRALPTGLSVEVNRDASNIGGSSSFLYDGCQINKMTLKQESGGFLMVSFDIVGEGDSSLVAVSTPTFATFTGVDWADLTTSYINGVTIALRSFEITVDNNLATDRYNLGANKRKGFGPNGNRSVTGKLTIEFASLTELNYWRNQTASNIDLTWTIGSGSFSISVLNCEFTAGEPTISEAGPITLDLEFEAYLSTTDNDEFQIVIINTTSSVP